MSKNSNIIGSLTVVLPAIAGIVIAVSVSGCNRVPGSRVKLERHASRSVNAIEVAVIEAFEQGAVDRGGPTTEDMELCVRACGHWVGLRFQSPDGMQRLSPDERNTVNELLEQQRALNRADCEEAASAPATPTARGVSSNP